MLINEEAEITDGITEFLTLLLILGKLKLAVTRYEILLQISFCCFFSFLLELNTLVFIESTNENLIL